MWDVAESTDGQLTSMRTEDTILAKYFSDFTNKKGEMKLVEEAYVELSGANTAKIGANQIKLSPVTDVTSTDDIAGFINADKQPKRDEELVTYKDGSAVVAYVPAEVASIANLAGRKVDVIFGEDNEVAYIVVVDDSVENVYVTAWDTTDDEIEIDGEAYEFADAAVVAVFGHPLTTKTGDTTDYAAVIDNLFVTDGTLANGRLDCLNSKDELVKNVVAEFILNGEDEIESINFKFSANGYTATTTETTPTALKINEFLVEKVSSKNALTVVGTSSENDLDDYEDITNLRVIKNGEVAEVADIEVGDVVTEIVYGTKAEVMIVTSNTVEGEVADYLAKTNALEIDGTDYKVVVVPFVNDEGDIEELAASTADNVFDLFEEETVTAYLNFAGEVVAVVGESEATGTVLGVVTAVSDEYDEDNEVDYVKAKILAEDGSHKYYAIYKNSKKNKDLEMSDVSLVSTANQVVMFEANADREIIAEDIRVIAGNETGLDFKSNSDVDVTTSVTEVKYDDKTIDSKRFSSSTVVINAYEKELMNGWQALAIDAATDKLADNTKEFITKDEYDDLGASDKANWTTEVKNDANEVIGYEKSKATTTNYIFTKGTKVVYVVTWVDEYYYGASDEQYGILLDVNREKDEDDETIYIATVLVDGVEETYECEAAVRNYDEGTFIAFKVSGGEFKVNPTPLVYKDIVEYIADATSDTTAMAAIATYLPTAYTNNADVKAYFKTISASTKFNALKVDTVEVVDGETYIIFDDEDATTTPVTSATTVDLADNYIVYDLEASEMAEEINEGDYILVVDYDTDDKGFEIVIVL